MEPEQPCDPGLARMQRYFEWCDVLRARPVPEAAVAFRYASVKTLTLRDPLPPLDLAAICEMLKFDNVIHTLDCDDVVLGDHGAHVLADLLPIASHLREVRLSRCGFSGVGGAAILRSAAQAPALQRLSLRGNPLGLAGATALAKVLRRTRTLAYIDVSHCALQRAGVNELTRALIFRAQRRLDRTRRQQLNAAGHAGAAPVGQDAGGRARAASSEDVEHPSAALTSGGVTVWGLLFGDVSELVVTTDATVRTIWRTGPGDTHGKPLISGHTHSHADGASGGGGTPALDGAPQQDDDLDIEVRIAGNFVIEESINAAIHGTGLLAAVCGALPLLRGAQQTHSTWHALGASAYILSLIGFFATATMNHALFMIDNILFRVLDHSAAFALIAGTYTPFLLVNLSFSPLGIGLLALVWLLALVGILLSTACRSSPLLQRVRLVLYGLMGWLGLIPYALVYVCIRPQGWQLLMTGGVCFTLGIALYSRERKATATIYRWWYSLVLAACAVHYFAVLNYVEAPSTACLASAGALGVHAYSADRHGAQHPVDGGGGGSPLPYQLAMQLGTAGQELGSALAAVQSAALLAQSLGQRAVVDGMKDILTDALQRLEAASVSMDAAAGGGKGVSEL